MGKTGRLAFKLGRRVFINLHVVRRLLDRIRKGDERTAVLHSPTVSLQGRSGRPVRFSGGTVLASEKTNSYQPRTVAATSAVIQSASGPAAVPAISIGHAFHPTDSQTRCSQRPAHSLKTCRLRARLTTRR
jgi:hypothetical protein